MPKDNGVLGRTRRKPYVTGDPNHPADYFVEYDPRFGAGVKAKIGSTATRNIADVDAELYLKFGPANTDWRLLTGLGPGAQILCMSFELADWVPVDLGDKWGITLVHGLSGACPGVDIYDLLGRQVITDIEKITDDSVRIKVARAGMEPGIDCRFEGIASIIA